MLSDVAFPILPLRKSMVCQIRRPTPFDNVLCASSLHDNLVCKLARLGHDEHVERIIQILVIDNGVFKRIFRPQLDTASAMLVEQQRTHGERVFAVDGEIRVLLGSAVELRVPELDVGLVGCEAHGVAAGFSRGLVPERRVVEAVVETRPSEDAKGECGEDSGFLFFPELVGGFGGVVVVREVVVCEVGL